MRIINFAKRNIKELIRDPLGIVFSIILPLFLLFIFQQFKIPNDAYKLTNFTPGIIIFSFSFITLFTATLIARDRETSLLIRLGVSPMKSYEYILGYMLSLLPIIIIQNILLFTLSIVLGLKFSIGIIWAILASIIVSILFIAIGILFGSLFKEKSASGISSVVVQLVCFTSGMYFSKDIVGKGFAKLCELLPFEASLNIIKAALNNDCKLITISNIVVFIIYTVLLLVLSIVIFNKKMTSDNKYNKILKIFRL